MKKTFATAVAALALAFTLTACGVTETPEPVETATPPAPTETVTPTPDAEPTAPPADEFEGEVVERNADGVIVAPDGSIIECPNESNGAFIADDGTVSCDAGVDW